MGDAGTVGNVLGKLGKIAEAAGIDPGKALGGIFGKKEAPPGPVEKAPDPKPAPADGTAARKPFGMANIKSFSFNGPLGYSIGIAKDATASVADITADLSFTGGDWKVVGIRPRI